MIFDPYTHLETWRLETAERERVARHGLRPSLGLVLMDRVLLAIFVAGVLLASLGASETPPAPAAPTGNLYPVGGRSLYLDVLRPRLAHGDPVDAGVGSDHTEWTQVQGRVARFTRVCSWDRPGRGRSSGARGRAVVIDLHGLLLQAGVQGPMVLVGHSTGGLDVRLYQEQYPNHVVGLVLAEATPEQQELDGSGIESSRGEAIDFSTAARGLERSSPGDLPVAVIERQRNTDPTWEAEQSALSVRSANSMLVLATRSDHAVEIEQADLVAAVTRDVAEAGTSATLPTECPTNVTSAGGRCLTPGSAPAEEGLLVTVPMLLGAGLVVLIAGLALGSTGLALRRAARTATAHASD